MFLVVNASMNELSYIVNEDDGFVEACVVLEGLIQREVVIQLFTLDDTAIGNILIKKTRNQHVLFYCSL